MYGAIQKLLLSNKPEYAILLAQQFKSDSFDHVLTQIFLKTVFYEQMSITNSILEKISNKNLKEVLDSSYLNN